MPPIPRTLSENKLGLHEIEQVIKDYWSSINLDAKLRYRGTGRKFYFLDGPPYASAKSVHLGTIWNKVIKDSVIRYKRMSGYDVWDKPGYDTHGLPIEVKVEQLLGLKSKKDIEEKVGVDKFVAACRDFARENIESMTRQFRDVGVSMDWGNPYITYHDDYISSGWWLVKKAWEQGLLDKELKIVHWCPRCETTLADYEVSEYVELEDPSIYVKFRVKGSGNKYLLIWTTTPWTLPANSFVMAHPDITYCEVKVKDEVLILAKSRVPEVMKEAGINDYVVLREFKGKELESVEYEHPLEDLVPAQQLLKAYHRVVLTEDGVTESEGTGLVHSAPGHGEIDYDVGKKVGSPVISLVDEKGYMTKDAGFVAGLYFRSDANKQVVAVLQERNALLHKGKIRHRYPVCWRCKTPLVLRAAPQWVIRVTKLKSTLMTEADKVRWIPEWAKTRFKNMLQELRDWIISRQRYWGIPLPVWICEKCGSTRVIGSLEELERESGIKIENAHRPWVDNVKLRCSCGGVMHRVPDVMDVWFDSGIAFYASLGYPKNRELYEKLEPVDFIVEGHDQIRGWFFSLLRSGIIGFGKSPYTTVLVHGFMLDEQGREMHKSLGNYVEPEELLKKYSRDTVRLMLLSNTVWEDLRFSYKALDLAKRDLGIAINVFSFASMYMGLDGFDPSLIKEDLNRHLFFEDKWILSRLNRLIRDYKEAMDKYEVHRAARLLRAFIVEDVSHWYIRLIRRRVWVEENSIEKITAYSVLFTVLSNWLKLAAPFIPHVADYLYVNFVKPADPNAQESVHLEELPSYDESLINDELEEKMSITRDVIEEALRLRMRAGINIRKPVKRLYITKSLAGKLDEEQIRIIKELVNTKEVVVIEESDAEGMRKPLAKPIQSSIGRAFRHQSGAVINYIMGNSERVAMDIVQIGVHKAVINGEELELTKDHVEVEWVYPQGIIAGEVHGGTVLLDARIDEELYLEGIAREVIRRVQVDRKTLNLPVEAYIKLCVEGDADIIKAVELHRNFIAGETRASSIATGKCSGYKHRSIWDLEGLSLQINIDY